MKNKLLSIPLIRIILTNFKKALKLKEISLNHFCFHQYLSMLIRKKDHKTNHKFREMNKQHLKFQSFKQMNYLRSKKDHIVNFTKINCPILI